jgi:hypothetical protein
MRDKTLNIHMCRLYSATSLSKVSQSSGRAYVSDKVVKILHAASINKPSDMIHDETSTGVMREFRRYHVM